MGGGHIKEQRRMLELKVGASMAGKAAEKTQLGAKGASSIFFRWAKGASPFFPKRGFGLFFKAKRG